MSYKKLEVWQLSRGLVIDIHKMTRAARCEALPRHARAVALPPKRLFDGRAIGGGVTRQSHVTSLLFFHHLAHTYLDTLGRKLNRFLQSVRQTHKSPK